MSPQEFDAAPAEQLRSALLDCCAAPSWADAVLAARPYAGRTALLDTADRAARALTPDEVDGALAAHPRIGERTEGDSTAAAWSRQEQSGVAAADELVAGNRAYEARFGRVFLICATGLSGEDILAALHDRLGNDAATEAAVVADELRKIALLRLERVLG